ncbi:hypothetical protein NQ314_006515 [Rhamnusium bicolor]|uniref:KIF-binding protein n=1 Tax=Rhamnusium bicolor TaxID=1586634 RepID=A0AAV8Z260_9CUCU|nr:hypothetical protein NQ314_006515 [Rhamnusium bicolor]
MDLPEGFLDDLKQQFQNIKAKSTNNDKEASEKMMEDSGDGNTKDENLLENQFSLIVSKLDKVLSTIKKGSGNYLKVLSMKASIFYEKAKIALTNSLFEKSKEYLEDSLNLIQEYAMENQITFLHLRIVNYLSYVLSRLGKLEEAKVLLEKVINADFKSTPTVYSTEDLFSNTQINEIVAKSKVDKLVINNMQMLGWIYGKMGTNDLYASMQHRCLQKELDLNDGDPIQWAIKCYRLASTLLNNCKWSNARYHLTAAQVVLDPLEAELTPNPLLHRAQAELARIWVNYGLHLFSVSKKFIMEKKWNEENENKNLKTPEVSDVPDDFKFTDLEIHVPSVPISEVYKIEEAKSLFLHTHKWLKRARLYYTLRDYPLHYVNIILELSELYRLLAFYESDLESQYDLQKKRFDTLETLSGVLKEVRPNCYVAVSVELIREIIEVQIELMNINLKKLYNPNIDANMNEEDLKRRMEAVGNINSKMENLGRDENQQYTENTGVDVPTEKTISKVDACIKSNEPMKEKKVKVRAKFKKFDHS